MKISENQAFRTVINRTSAILAGVIFLSVLYYKGGIETSFKDGNDWSIEAKEFNLGVPNFYCHTITEKYYGNNMHITHIQKNLFSIKRFTLNIVNLFAIYATIRILIVVSQILFNIIRNKIKK